MFQMSSSNISDTTQLFFTHTESTAEELSRYKTGIQWQWLALVVVPIWILCGNSLVLLSVWIYRSLRTLSNCVIASLAFTDFLLAFTVVPLGIYQLVSIIKVVFKQTSNFNRDSTAKLI